MKRKNHSEKRSYVFTRETLGITILLFCALITIMLFTRKIIFGGLGTAICTFMYGTFGYASFLIIAALAYLGEWLAFEKSVKVKPRAVLCVAATVFALFLLFHAVTTKGYGLEGYGSYLSACYHNAANGIKGYSFGGVISGLLVFPVAKGTTFIGAYVIFSLLTVALGVLSFFIIRNIVLGNAIARASSQTKSKKREEKDSKAEVQSDSVDNLYTVNENHEIVANNAKSAAKSAPVRETEPRAVAPAPEQKSGAADDKYSRENLGRKILFEPGEFSAESYRRNMIYNENSYFNHPVINDDDYLSSFSDGSNSKKPSQKENNTYTQSFSSEVENGKGVDSAPSYVYGDSPVNSLGDNFEDEEEVNDSYTVDQTPTDILREEPEDDVDVVVNPRNEQPDFNYRAEQAPSRNDILNSSYSESVRGDRAVENTLPSEPIIDRSEELRQPVRDNPVRDSSVRDGRGAERSSSIFNLFSASNPRLSEQQNRVEPDVSSLRGTRGETTRENIFDEEEDSSNLFGDSSSLVSADDDANDAFTEAPVRERGLTNVGERGLTNVTEEEKNPVGFRQPSPVAPVRRVEEPAKEQPKPVEAEKPKHVWKQYVRPSLELLDDYPENTNINPGEIEDSKRIIVETLASFRIASQVSNVIVGPAITRYDVIIEDKTNIKNALKYREAIAMALMKENVNAYLNYSKGAISIEVPNSSRTVVGLKGMLANSVFLNAKQNSLTFALGKNVEGQVVCPDITKMPHLLVAGTTGSGKSICLSTLIVSLLYKYGPEELRFILVDPKQVEFISYDKLPHLMINEIIYDIDKAIKALNWAIKEMERRYQLFKEMTERGVATKNLTEYNAHLPAGEEKLPKIVIILDEFGDLMLQAKKDIESRIIRLVQKARACGIHLILATQRPSVDCITGLIKSNLPTRIGFKVNSFDDARTIFDIGGAEKLLGKGDMYYRSAENPELARIQGCFIDTHEVQKVTDFIKQHNETYFDQSVSDFINTVEEEVSDAPAAEGGAGADDPTKVDDTFIKALKFCVTSNQASVSMIQRRFPIGYMKACKIIDWMETMNYITQSEGSKPRKVLLSREEFILKYGDVDD